MKKIIFSFFVLILLTTSSCFADCLNNCQTRQSSPEFKTYSNDCTQQNEQRCDKCNLGNLDDDEYCIYNQCFFDKHYRKMKKALCLTKKQETCIDNIYRNFKTDMENMHAKYRNEKNKLLEMIECKNDCYKDQVKVLKKLKKDCREKCKEFRDDVKEQLCKNQYSDFRKFQRHEKRKMKKIIKYGAIYKLPCVDCCK